MGLPAPCKDRALLKASFPLLPGEEATRIAGEDACTGKVQRVFLTGISGMIGSELMRFLLHSPCRVVYGLVRQSSNLENLASHKSHPRLKLVYGDVTDAFRMRELVELSMPHYIYHFAGDGAGVADNNGMRNLLEALRVSNLHRSTRFLFASSSEVYGKTAADYNGSALPETAALQPISPYGVSKLASERLATQFFIDYGVPVIAARLFVHAAPGGGEHGTLSGELPANRKSQIARQHGTLQGFCRQIALIEAGKLPPVIHHGDLALHRDITDVRDSVSAMILLAERGEPGEAYNIGSGLQYSIRDVLQLAMKEAQVEGIRLKVDPLQLRAVDEKSLTSDNRKLRRVTGWKPQPDMPKTVRDILQYWRQQVGNRGAPSGDNIPGAG